MRPAMAPPAPPAHMSGVRAGRAEVRRGSGSGFGFRLEAVKVGGAVAACHNPWHCRRRAMEVSDQRHEALTWQ